MVGRVAVIMTVLWTLGAPVPLNQFTVEQALQEATVSSGSISGVRALVESASDVRMPIGSLSTSGSTTGSETSAGLVPGQGSVPAQTASSGPVLSSGPAAGLSGQIPPGSGSIPLGNLGVSVPKTESAQTCCQKLPQVCDAQGDCVLDYTLCTKLCLCVSGLPVFMCQHMLKSIAGDIAPFNNKSQTTNSTTSSIKSSAQLIPSATLQFNSEDSPLLPSTINTTQIPQVSSSYETPSLDRYPTTVTTVPHITSQSSRSHNDDAVLLKPMYNRQTASTVFTGKHTSFVEDAVQSTVSDEGKTPWEEITTDNGNETGRERKDSEVTALSELTSVTTTDPLMSDYSECENCPGTCTFVWSRVPAYKCEEAATSTEDYSNFAPPAISDVSPCENCTGTCLFDWNRIPMFECEDGENHRCNAFDCGEHGTCVEEENGHVGCECDSEYIGTFCDHVCDLDCGLFGECAVFNKTMHCVCKWNYTGQHCTELRTTTPPLVKEIHLTPEPAPWAVIGVCIGSFILLLLVLVVLPYWMWRRQWLPMRKLVHYFQAYEDDDGKEFDAFISYKSTKEDEDFVVHKLYPKLEKELDFKLCMHFRDFPPGAAIADNIIKAIESSRRTIMLLSPAYVESEWCRLEYQKAQHEMLKMKHRIIPIMLEDISKCSDIDKNLQQILNTVTYIQYPSDEDDKKLDRFWKLMVCAMPKKQHDAGQSETSGGSSSSDLPLTSSPGTHFQDGLCDDVFSDRGESFINSESFQEKVGRCTNADSFTVDISKNDSDIVCEANADVHQTDCKLCDSVLDFKLDTAGRDASDISVDPSKSDAHVVEIRKLPGNKLKILKRMNLNWGFGNSESS